MAYYNGSGANGGPHRPTVVTSDAIPSASSHMLSASISSLSSISSARPSSTHVSKTYRQASTLFLTRRLPEALSTVLPLITPPPTEDEEAGEPAPVARSSRTTRIKVWSLYLTILNAILELDQDEGKDAFGTKDWRAICTKVRDGGVWEEVVRNGYHGVEGNVDSDVVINLTTLLLAHARDQTLNQKRLESYLAAASTPNLDLSDRFSPSASKTRLRKSPARGTSGADTPRDLNARVKILELYTLHVLVRNNEWEYARDIIGMSPVLDDERREAFLQALQSLQDDQQEEARREREEKERQDEQRRQELEDARRQRVANEELERRRLDEERARREGSEVDYGIERTPSHRGRQAKKPSPSAAAPASVRSGASTSNREKAVAPPSLSARTAMFFSNMRNLVEQLNVLLHTNPGLLLRTVAFIVGLLLMFSRKSIRDRLARVLGTGWNKVRATAGMGLKVSYI